MPGKTKKKHTPVERRSFKGMALADLREAAGEERDAAQAIIDGLEAEAEERDLTDEESADFKAHTDNAKRAMDQAGRLADLEALNDRRADQRDGAVRRDTVTPAPRSPEAVRHRPHVIGGGGSGGSGGGAERRAETRHGVTLHGGGAEGEERSVEIDGERIALEPDSADYHRAAPAYDTAFRSAMRGEALTDEHRAALDPGMAEGGALLVPMTWATQIRTRLDNSFKIMQLATVYNSDEGDFGIHSEDTSMGIGSWEGDTQAIAEDESIGLGGRVLGAHRIGKNVVVPNKLLRTRQGFETFLLGRINYAVQGAMEQATMTGDGAKKPLGLFTADAKGISTARDTENTSSQTVVSADSIIDCLFSIPEQYRNRPGFRVTMNRLVRAHVEKLKDGNGEYLVNRNGMIAGQPVPTLLGVPIVESEYAPSAIAQSAYVMVFGDLSFYDINVGLGFSVLRDPFKYAEKDQTRFVCSMKGDGQPHFGEAFGRLQMKTT
jgi:HK97 family phage major capsid protein